ncbi:related to pathway-specific regulatory protein nit-4 [Phialocephala subalpina]|uniref:Related to pathway-specific regulatory protein nit-4 n=1 Tax=Phialocephala subalpina TaxID=576137 RepID=A0A1L7XNA6_9HELO|nr:related to pathway-specific regulatory protein nit-4 [Phialocephala subalpina]
MQASSQIIDVNGSIENQSRACRFCRVRKIKCDKKEPACTSCARHKRHCVYSYEKPKPRPSSAIISAIQKEKRDLETALIKLKTATPEEAISLLNQITVIDGCVKCPHMNGALGGDELNAYGLNSREARSSIQQPREALPVVHEANKDNEAEEQDQYESDGEFDASKYLSVDDQGQVGVFGLTSTLHNPAQTSVSKFTPSHEVRNQLVANAALERQKEFSIRLLPDIDGVPLNLAMHLLDLHWNRQHHTFLLTYRPAFMRDLVHGGQYCSKFLLNAIFACASKYSDRVELRDDPLDSLTAGRRFFLRCDELLLQDPPWSKPSIPTVVGFLLLGSTFVSLGEISRGWSYTGFALRMAFDLGLHLDCRKPGSNAEDVEIRKRVYWGAFICDKLQSLYLGRPFMMQLRDCHVSTELMDTMEELDLWVPYVDPESPDSAQCLYHPTPVHSVSTFQKLCELSKLMARVISRFYSAGATPNKAQAALKNLDESLTRWHDELPASIAFEPWSEDPAVSRTLVSPNVMNLHNTYHSLVILLHRPFISEGHLRSGSVATSSWKKCTVAARNITSIVGAYRSAYSLRGAPYLTSYAAYVACTIHVRNAALEGSQSDESLRLLLASLKTLDELSVPNPGVSRPATIIRRLLESNGIVEPPVTSPQMNAGYDFDINATPKSIELSSLFDTFSQDMQGFGVATNIDTMRLDNNLNDSLFGFMDNTYLPDQFEWS